MQGRDLMSVLKDLYYKNAGRTAIYVKKGGEYDKVNKVFTERIEKLCATFNKEQQKLFEDVEESVIDLSEIRESDCYADGVSLGARWMLEVMNFKSENFTD